MHVNLDANIRNGIMCISSDVYCSTKSSAFQNFTQINTLYLDMSHMDKLEANTFKKLLNLKKLVLNFDTLWDTDLDRDPFAMDTNAFNGLENLEELFIYAPSPCRTPEKLEELSFANFKHLKYVELQSIVLTSVSDHFFCMASQLESINLIDNKMNSISIYGLQGLNKLQKVWIQKNEIETLNLQLFANLPCLNLVALYSNKIKRIENKRDDEMP